MQNATPRTVRFWAWANDGQVRITLRPGQTRHWARSYPTDEGWNAEGETWTHEGDHVARTSWTDGRDCDGRMSTDTRLECALERLTDRRDSPDWEPSPDWLRVESSQRDYQAEAAGY
jgi:hypothetical protein